MRWSFQNFYVISKEEVEEQIDNAIRFCDEVKVYLEKQYIGLNQ